MNFGDLEQASLAIRRRRVREARRRLADLAVRLVAESDIDPNDVLGSIAETIEEMRDEVTVLAEEGAEGRS